ncbi:MAG: GNAT family N-acetyltransferase [Deinococcales bacterium]|nr:GNAT family N-acetyltransferase [Deinococcales bacterium]
MRLVEVDDDNRRWVDEVFAGDEAQYWVHYNRYWVQNARTHPDIAFRLIEVDEVDRPVGVIAYGQHYQDEALTRPVPGAGEVIHTVIDVAYQRRGYGKRATLEAIARLRPRYERVLIAYNPANEPARRLYESLGFQRVGTNYDGDPLLELRNQPG